MREKFMTRRKWLLLLVAGMAVCFALWERPVTPLKRTLEMTREFWVWHRSSNLTPDEMDALHRQGVRRLLWRAGELAISRSGQVRVSARVPQPARLAPGFMVVPTFRLTDSAAWLEREKTASDVAEIMRSLIDADCAEVQLDYDCRAVDLGEYAAFLKELRAQLPTGLRLSVTMLASHARHNALSKVAEQVDAFYPMFYDLRADGAAAVEARKFRPIADVEELETWIDAWKRCGKPWVAGLPAFARVTAYDAGGGLIGHWRDWSAAELWRCGLMELGTVVTDDAARGTVAWQLAADISPLQLGDHAIPPGATLLLRWSEQTRVHEMMRRANDAGAWGIAMFRLPGSGGVNLHSIDGLVTANDEGIPQPKLKVSFKDGQIVVENRGRGDLLPRWQTGKPHRLHVAVDDGGLHQLSAGTFLEVAGLGGDAVVSGSAAVFSFVHLRSGERVVTGRFDSARSKDSIKWKLNDGTWQRF